MVAAREMNLRVVDTEFQFDRRKLTIFFEADDFVQFHHFVRDIYKAYKTRIWLEQVGGTGSLTRPKDGPNDWDAQKGGARAQHVTAQHVTAHAPGAAAEVVGNIVVYLKPIGVNRLT